jgi:type I restriction-modification system DNA methylase subunit
MILSEEVKQKIKDEYESWFNKQYGSTTKEYRKSLGAVFTPPSITIKMIERFESIKDKTILDPTCGTGNLLAACIIAGANPKLIYGNEYDEEFLRLCKERLCKMGVPEENLHQGDATDPDCLNYFGKDYKYVTYEQSDLW